MLRFASSQTVFDWRGRQHEQKISGWSVRPSEAAEWVFGMGQTFNVKVVSWLQFVYITQPALQRSMFMTILASRFFSYETSPGFCAGTCFIYQLQNKWGCF
jgi:hypothetical protein